jgi:hypothetical protein
LLIAAPIPRVPPVTNATRAMSISSLGYFFISRNCPVFLINLKSSIPMRALRRRLLAARRDQDENARHKTGHFLSA